MHRQTPSSFATSSTEILTRLSSSSISSTGSNQSVLSNSSVLTSLSSSSYSTSSPAFSSSIESATSIQSDNDFDKDAITTFFEFPPLESTPNSEHLMKEESSAYISPAEIKTLADTLNNLILKSQNFGCGVYLIDEANDTHLEYILSRVLEAIVFTPNSLYHFYISETHELRGEPLTLKPGVTLKDLRAYFMVDDTKIDEKCICVTNLIHPQLFINVSSKINYDGFLFKIDVFCASNIPSTTLENYLSRFAKYIRLELHDMVLAINFLTQYICSHKDLFLHKFNVHRLLLASLCCQLKMWEDRPRFLSYHYDNSVKQHHLNNKTLAQIGGISVKELNNLEIEMLMGLSFDLWIPPEKYTLFKNSIFAPVIAKQTQILEPPETLTIQPNV